MATGSQNIIGNVGRHMNNIRIILYPVPEALLFAGLSRIRLLDSTTDCNSTLGNGKYSKLIGLTDNVFLYHDAKQPTRI